MNLASLGEQARGMFGLPQRPDTRLAPPAEDPILALVEKRFAYARDAKTDMLETWATCLAFFVGQQWRRWDKQARRLVAPDRIPPWRVLMVDNQLPGILDTAAAKLARARQIPRALPTTNEPEDQAAARAGSLALDHWWRLQQFDVTELKGNFQRMIFGASFFHDYWDPNVMARVAVPGMIPGMPQQARTAPVGDVRVELLSPFDVFPEPCRDWSDVTWVVLARRRPLHWFKSQFGEEIGAKVKADSGGDAHDVFRNLIPGQHNQQNAGGAPDDDKLATLKVYYEKPCAQYPEGRHVMVAGGQVLFQADRLPMPHGEIPVTMLPYRYVPERMWPMGLVEVMLDQQRELNRGQGNLAELFRLFRSPKWFIDRSWKIDEKAITSAPDEVVEGNFNGAVPYVHQPPALPAWVAGYADNQRESIRVLAGQNEVSEGGAPPGVTAASALQILNRQNDTRLGTPARLGKPALETVAKHVLAAMVERYREPRLISIVGRDRATQVMALVGADIGDRDVIVDLTEGVQDTDEMRAQQVADWLGLGMFQQPPEFQLTIFREVGQDWLAEAMEQAIPAMQARQQAEALAQQQQLLAASDAASAAKLQEQAAGQQARQQDAEAGHQRALELEAMRQQGRQGRLPTGQP